MVDQLRRAGYLQRRVAPVSEPRPVVRGAVRWHERTYLDASGWLGSRLAGKTVVDCWALAHRVSVCCAHYRRTLHAAGVVDLAMRCDAPLVCPTCASARAGLYASAVRRVAASLTRPEGEGYREAGRALLEAVRGSTAALPDVRLEDPQCRLVTWTQRAVAGEPLEVALDRLRMALSPMVSKRRMSSSWRQAWDHHRLGVRYQVEVVRGWAGKREGAPRPPARACWWHAHVHVVLLGDRVDDLKDWVEQRWQMQTESASWSVRGDGAGAADPASRRDGGWWREVSLESLREVYQATKYLCPGIVDLTAAETVELVTVARAGRLAGGAGTLRGCIVGAEALEAVGQPDPCPPPIPRPDWGPRMVSPAVAPLVTADEARTPLSGPLIRLLQRAEDADAARTVLELAQLEGGPVPSSSTSWAAMLDAAAELTTCRVTDWRVQIARVARAERESWAERHARAGRAPPARLVAQLEVAGLVLEDESAAHAAQLERAAGARAHARWSVDLEDLTAA